MREAAFMLPMEGNDGSPPGEAFHKMLTLRLTEVFGGVTAIPAVGGWWNGEKGMVEAVVEYRVAMLPDAQEDFMAFALAAARTLRQEVLYWRDLSGEVHLESVGGFSVH